MIFKITFIILITLTGSFSVFSEELTINITGAIAKQGKIFIAIFNKPDEFPSGKAFKLITLPSPVKSHQAVLQKVILQKGVYAVAAFQDSNSNSNLDLNFFKRPTERTGTSGKKTFGRPKFLSASFKLDKNLIVPIRLN